MANQRPVYDIYDEEFANNLQIAKNLVSKLSSRTDKQICKKWIGKLCRLKSDDPVVKKNRNAFFKYLLEILSKAILDAATDMGIGAEHQEKVDDDHFMCKWSEDKRTYIAAKPLPGQGALIYMAVTRYPNLGWDRF
ncbi:uncharacterized protein LOC132707770 [Cylas formicarius]|uniref:uncharacterized protein LOC132707770 n=1 Tax=Cylas formicarius TaxID=197179 RepID=UPI0029584670|nr:uncharacterized protein LOC132707770 [Cylas formicarius]